MNAGFVDKVLGDCKKLKEGRSYESYLWLIVLWTVFEAWIAEESSIEKNVEGPNGCLEWFEKNDNVLKDVASGFWKSTATNSILNTFWQHKSLIRYRPDKNKVEKCVITIMSDINKPYIIAKALYRIRNNVVHGNWQIDYTLNNQAEKQLIDASAQLLYKWLECAKSDIN